MNSQSRMQQRDISSYINNVGKLLKDTNNRFMLFFNGITKSSNFQQTIDNIKQQGWYPNDILIFDNQQLYELLNSGQSYLSRLNWTIIPDRKYHFYLDIDEQKDYSNLQSLLKTLQSFGKYTITQRTKKDKSLSFHVVFYETVCSMEFIQQVCMNLFLDNDIDPSVYSKNRPFREVLQNKFGEENTALSPYESTITVDNCHQYCPQIFDQTLELNEQYDFLKRKISPEAVLLQLNKQWKKHTSVKKFAKERFTFLEQYYETEALYSERDRCFRDKDGLTYSQHQAKKQTDLLKRVSNNPKQQQLQQDLQNEIDVINDKIEKVKNNKKSKEDKQRVITKYHQEIKELTDKYMQLLEFNYTEFEGITADQQNIVKRIYNDFSRVSYQIDTNANQQHDQNTKRYQFVLCLVNMVRQYFEKDMSTEILKHLLNTMKQNESWEDCDDMMFNRMLQLNDEYDKDGHHISLYSYARSYGVVVKNQQIEVIDGVIHKLNNDGKLITIDDSIDLNEKGSMIDLLNKIQRGHDFEEIELIKELKQNMVFILSRNGYFTKQYDDYSKIMKIQDDANFLKTCEIYTVTIEGKSMQLDKFVKKNIMLFKKHDIHFCQYGTESSQDYQFLFQYPFIVKQEYQFKSDVEQINSGNVDNLQNKALQHIKQIWCNNNLEHTLYILRLIAWQLQNINKKSGVVPILLSQPGAGKNIITNALCSMYGQFAQGNIEDMQMLVGDFNPLKENMKMIVCNELRDKNNKVNFDRLKTLITEVLTVINQKNQQHRQAYCFENYWFLSNHKNSVRLEVGDRRYFPLQLNNVHCPKTIENITYFNTVNQDCTGDIFFNIFMNLDVKTFNPTQMPFNQLKEDIIHYQENSVMQYLRDNIDEIRDNVALLQHSEYVAYCQFKEFSKDQIYNYKVYKEVLKDLEFINNEWEVDIDLICKYFNISATEVPVDDLTKFFQQVQLQEYFQIKDLFTLYQQQGHTQYSNSRSFGAAVKDKFVTYVKSDGDHYIRYNGVRAIFFKKTPTI